MLAVRRRTCVSIPVVAGVQLVDVIPRIIKFRVSRVAGSRGGGPGGGGAEGALAPPPL